jgi:hypothetical protein
LAGFGLETFHVYSSSTSGTKSTSSIALNQNSVGISRLESFWSTIATSKTLRDLQLPDQLIGGYNSDEVAMVGRFLKLNRSVQRIGFDSSLLVLKVEDVKVLRSTFYGNKKIIDLEYLSKARQLTMSEVQKETQMLLVEVKQCKAERIFKSHYSKYNRNWRNTPNTLKLPWVEKIRVAKREIGKLQRDSNKIGQLLTEINNEPYPINYLRNVALLEARRQHLRFNSSLDKSAVLLVDVDFRLSNNLYDTVHSGSAVESILKHRRVIVCPAFESTIKDNCAQTVTSLRAPVEARQAEGFHISHFPQGHTPTQFDKFWNISLECDGKTLDEYWEKSYKIQYEKLFEPYIIMASADVPLYDERFQGYGLNKVSHLATVAAHKGEQFFVLPGVFLLVSAHERSESWSNRYDTRTDETRFNQLVLKGLYYNFMKNLEDGNEPIVSENTKSKERLLLLQERESKRKDDESKCTQTNPVSCPTKSFLCY